MHGKPTIGTPAEQTERGVVSDGLTVPYPSPLEFDVIRPYVPLVCHGLSNAPVQRGRDRAAIDLLLRRETDRQ